MSKLILTAAMGISLIGALPASQAQAQSAGGQDNEVALLKAQLKQMEQKLDQLQKQTTANTASAAKANAKVDAKVASLGNGLNTPYPVKGPILNSGVVVTM